MQIPTYQRYRLAPLGNPPGPKKPKQSRRSFLSDASRQSNVSLSPMRVQGVSISQTKLIGGSTVSCPVPSRRSQSQQSIRTDVSLTNRSRSITPSGTSRMIRLKFGHPVIVRSSNFYAPSLSESELRLREESFVNDSIRCAHQSRRSSLIAAYNPLNDPYLSDFFQSSLVLDAVHKTMNIDLERRSRPLGKRPKPSNKHVDDYRRIVAKRSSGYARLNGYDCIPVYARRRPPPTRPFETSLSSSVLSKKLTPLAHSSATHKGQLNMADDLFRNPQ